MSAKPRVKKSSSKKTLGQNNESKHFIVLNMNENASIGSNMVVLHATETQKLAEEFVNTLDGASPEYVCIVEQKVVLARRPEIKVSEVVRNAIK